MNRVTSLPFYGSATIVDTDTAYFHVHRGMYLNARWASNIVPYRPRRRLRFTHSVFIPPAQVEKLLGLRCRQGTPQLLNRTATRCLLNASTYLPFVGFIAKLPIFRVREKSY